MKRTGILMVIVLMASSLFAQPRKGQGVMREKMKQYINEQVVPFVQQERNTLISALSDEERSTLQDLQDEMKAFREQGKQIRESMKGNYNPELAKIRKNAFDSILNRSKTLINNHPDAVAEYKSHLEKEKKVWEKDMREMFPDKKQSHPGISNNPMLKRLDDPAFVLLWDGTQIPWHAMNKRFERHQKHVRMMADSATREKVKNYVKQNIMPVVLAEQAAFEANFLGKEKKKIETARELFKQRKEQFWENRMYAGAGNKPLLNDSLRLVRKLEMQKVMIPVNEIALKHYSEIETHLEKIRAQMPEWRKDIAEITGRKNIGKGRKPVMNPVFRRLRRLNSPDGFLLFTGEFIR